MSKTSATEEMGQDEQGKIKTLIRTIGEPKASKALGIDRQTALRACAGLPVQRRTADHLRRVLASVTASTSTEPSPQLPLPCMVGA